MSKYQGIIHAYEKYLPVKEKHIVSLCEGRTPLLECRRLTKKLNLKARLFLKFEGLNPTGSFKDRGMTYAVSKACEAGSRTVICASTGNTSASAAAYAARAGLKCLVLIPKGQIAYGKLSQAMQHGARVIQIRGSFDQALAAVVEIAKKFPVTVVNSINPHRLPGQMTAAFEVVDELGDAPDFHFLPVGNAANITAYWSGYKRYHQEQKSKTLPQMMGFQAAGAAPIVLGRVVKNPKTVATAIRIGNPASWQAALAARGESRGVIEKVTDAEILRAYDLLAREEGYFCEPASAAGVAGVIKMMKRISFGPEQKIVCTLTGHGLKDPDRAVQRAQRPVVCSVQVKDIVKKMGI